MPTLNCGVYLLSNKRTGGTYIGATQDLESRKQAHLSNIRRRYPRPPYIDGFADATDDDVEFGVLEYVQRNDWSARRRTLRKRERDWMKKLLPTLNRQGMKYIHRHGRKPRMDSYLAIHLGDVLKKDLSGLAAAEDRTVGGMARILIKEALRARKPATA